LPCGTKVCVYRAAFNESTYFLIRMKYHVLDNSITVTCVVTRSRDIPTTRNRHEDDDDDITHWIATGFAYVASGKHWHVCERRSFLI
jgi:hypothetical protein